MNPLQQRKEELKAFIEARSKATMSLAFYDINADWVREIDFLPHGKLGKIICDLKDSTGVNRDLESESICANGNFIALAFNQSAQIAEDLLTAIEALEKAKETLLSLDASYENFVYEDGSEDIEKEVQDTHEFVIEALKKLTKAE